MNIEVCARYLKSLVEEFDYKNKISKYLLYEFNDIYDYISINYLGFKSFEKSKIQMLYSAILRGAMKDKRLYYTGIDNKRYSISIKKEDATREDYAQFVRCINEFNNKILISEKVFIENCYLLLKFVCYEEKTVQLIRQFFVEDEYSFEIDNV